METAEQSWLKICLGGPQRPEEKFFHSIFMHFSIAVWHRGPSAKNLDAMECLLIISGDVHIERRVSLAIFHQSKKKPHVFFPIMPAKEERNVLWFGFFKWRKPGVKKRYSRYLEKNNQNLRETSSEHGFLPLALVVLFEDVPPFWDATFFSAGENFPGKHPCSPSVAALRPEGGNFRKFLGFGF